MVDWQKILDVSKDQVEHGLEMHEKSIVCDSLAGVTPETHLGWLSDEMAKKANEMLGAGRPAREIRTLLEKTRINGLANNPEMQREFKEMLQKCGVTCTSATLEANNMASAMKSISDTYYLFDKLRDIIVLATRGEDIRRGKKEGRHAVILNFQNTLALGGGLDLERELDNINFFYGLGIRIIQLTYNLRTLVGDGCTERYDSGLSHYGVKVVERMNEVGMIVDTGHCGIKTTMDAVEVSKVPVVASHTCCRAVYNHPRGKTDEALQAIAEKGGYIGILMVPTFLAYQGTIVDWLNHVDHAVDLVGAEHIGIGTDNDPRSANYPIRLADKLDEEVYCGFWSGFKPEHRRTSRTYPPYPDVDLAWTNWPYYAAALLSRGYSDQEIQGIIGGNFLRFFESVNE